MRLDAAVVQDVTDGKTARSERTGDQETAVAIERRALRAHQAEPAISRPMRAKLPRIGDQGIEAGLKVGLPRHRLVVGDTVAIKIWTLRAATECGAVRQIANAILLQQRLKLVGREPGQKRENGVERTSAIAPTFSACSIATKRSVVLLEWPML